MLHSVSKCHDDMEGLVADSNRSIATLAITTLLKIGMYVHVYMYTHTHIAVTDYALSLLIIQLLGPKFDLV